MAEKTITKKILVYGVNNLFGEEIVRGLAVDGNELLLCSDSENCRRRLIENYPGYVKGVSSRDEGDYLKQIQVMIESIGTLDAVIYLVQSRPPIPFFEQSLDQINGIFQTNLIEPIELLRGIFPYLRKTSESKVIFVDSEDYLKNQSQSAVHQATQHGLFGFCTAMRNDRGGKGIDLRTISSSASNGANEGMDRAGGKAINADRKSQSRRIAEKIMAVICSDGNSDESVTRETGTAESSKPSVAL